MMTLRCLRQPHVTGSVPIRVAPHLRVSLSACTGTHQGNHKNSMAIKKSDLYSSLWASCDELRGGMDASQYKDYVLFMLFIK